MIWLLYIARALAVLAVVIGVLVLGVVAWAVMTEGRGDLQA